MPNPTPRAVHLDGYLTQFSIAQAQAMENFIAATVFPIVPVQNATDLYFIFEDEWFRRDEFEERPLGGRSKRIGYKTTSAQYSVIEESLAHAIDDRVRANADDPLNPDRAATRLLTEQAMIHMDRKWATAYFQSGVWDTDVDGVSANPTTGEILQWDQSGSNPMADIDFYKDAMHLATARTPNILVMGSQVYREVKQNAEILDRIKYTQTGVITQQLLASFFGVDKLVVAKGIWNTSPEGVAASNDWIVSPADMLLCYAPSSPAIEEPAAGYHFAWTNLIPGAGNAMGGVVERRRDEDAHSDIIELRTAQSVQVVSSALGVFFSDVVA